jgi:hypothetical protein
LRLGDALFFAVYSANHLGKNARHRPRLRKLLGKGFAVATGIDGKLTLMVI